MSEEEVKGLEEWSEPLTEDEVEADDFGEEGFGPLPEEVEEEGWAVYVALAPLSAKGIKNFVLPGETVELHDDTAAILIKKGKVRPLGDG